MKPRRQQRRQKVSKPAVTWSERCKKMSYSKHKIAKHQASIQRRNSGEEIEAYRCQRGCCAWHIGHPPGTRDP